MTQRPRGDVAPAGCTICVVVAICVALVAIVPNTPLVGEHVARAITDLGQMLFAFTAAATTGWRAWRSTSRARASWAALAVGCGGWAVGEAVWSWYELVMGRDTPFPSLADVGFLLFPIGACVALLRYATRDSAGDRQRHVLDSVTVTVAFALLSWATALGSVAHSRADNQFAFLVSLSYPASDLVVLTLLVLVLSRARATRGTLTLLGLGIAAITVADSAFVLFTSYGGAAAEVTGDVGWVVGFGLLTVAPLLRTSPAGNDALQDAARALHPSKLPYLPVVLAVVVVGAEMALGHQPDLVETSLSALTLALVLLRQYSVMRENARLVTTLSEREQQLRHQAFHDGLTGLANRALFHDRVTHALDLHRRDLRPLAVLFCDLDDFKLVNDTLGHRAGDELLVRVAERLRGSLRAGDTLGRLGGDEFAVLIEDGGDPWGVARQVIEVMSSPYTVRDKLVVVQASVGITVVDSESATPAADTLLAQADTAMYEAKRAGKGCVRAFEPGMELVEVTDDALRRRLSTAIAEGHITVAYQPIIDVATGCLLGFEALARWQDDGTTVPPEDFVAAAERTGLIGSLTQLVLDQACAQVAAWDAAGARQDFTVAVNISPQRIVDRSFPGEVLAALHRHRVSPARLVLEITESALLTDLGAAKDVTSRLDAHGIRFSLDDFGVGYSSLTHLSQIPLQSLKIDRAFTKGLDRDESQRRFTDAVVRFGANLGLEVIAEGVERVEQLDRLRELGCGGVQGFLLGRPEPAATWTPQLLGIPQPGGVPLQRNPWQGQVAETSASANA